MSWTTPLTLQGDYVVVKPLALNQAEQLIEAVCDGELWNLWYTRIPQPDQMIAEITRRLALQQAGSMLPFCIEDRHTHQVLGMTTFMNIEPTHRRVEIGSTWYRRSAQRSPVNTEVKRLLLTHAFEYWKCIAVEFRTSSFNVQSQMAIQRLGAKLDGVLRSHQIVQGEILRDTHVYSILQQEWPAVRHHLDYLMSKQR